MAKLSKKALFVKRSKAAKQGWATRKLNELQAQAAKAAKVPSLPPRAKSKPARREKPPIRKPAQSRRPAPKTRKKSAVKPSRLAKPAHRTPQRADPKTTEIARLRKQLTQTRAKIQKITSKEKTKRIAAVKKEKERGKQRSRAALDKARAKQKERQRQREKLLRQKQRQRDKRREQRERTEIRKANERALQSIQLTDLMITNLARNNVPIKQILKQVPESAQKHAAGLVIQVRLDMAAHFFNDVRFEAFDLADELDWDISDVFDAWDYDAEGAA